MVRHSSSSPIFCNPAYTSINLPPSTIRGKPHTITLVSSLLVGLHPGRLDLSAAESRIAQTLAQACVPRSSVFDPAIRDTVYNIDDLGTINADRFFTENYLTDGMKTLLSETFKRLEGRSENAPAAILLSQSMGGGKTHNLLAVGLLAKYPSQRARVMGSFYSPGSLGTVRTVAVSGRKTNTPFGIWGEIAKQPGPTHLIR